MEYLYRIDSRGLNRIGKTYKKKKKKENVKSLFIKLRTIEYEARRE